MDKPENGGAVANSRLDGSGAPGADRSRSQAETLFADGVCVPPRGEAPELPTSLGPIRGLASSGSDAACLAVPHGPARQADSRRVAGSDRLSAPGTAGAEVSRPDGTAAGGGRSGLVRANV